MVSHQLVLCLPFFDKLFFELRLLRKKIDQVRGDHSAPRQEVSSGLSTTPNGHGAQRAPACLV